MMLTPIILPRSEIFSHMEMRLQCKLPWSLLAPSRLPFWSRALQESTRPQLATGDLSVSNDDMAALLWLFKINDLSFLVLPTDLFVSVCPCPAPELFCLLIPPPGSMGLFPLTGFTIIRFPALSRYLSYLQNENPGILLPCPGHRCHHHWHGALNMVGGSPYKTVKLK